jgi:hypothetical protein
MFSEFVLCVRFRQRRGEIMSGKKSKEKFTIQMTGEGMEISSGKGRRLAFSACDALMLLDILKAEEENLRRIADEASPLPMRMFTTESKRA